MTSMLPVISSTVSRARISPPLGGPHLFIGQDAENIDPGIIVGGIGLSALQPGDAHRLVAVVKGQVLAHGVAGKVHAGDFLFVGQQLGMGVFFPGESR